MAENYGRQLWDSAKLSQGQSGMNLYNRMIQGGTRRVATNRDQIIQQAVDIGIRNPAMLRLILAEATNRTGGQLSELETQAGIAGENVNQQERQRLTQIGLSLEQMDRQERLEKDRMRREERIGLISSVVGGGLGLAGGLIQAGAAKFAAKTTADALGKSGTDAGSDNWGKLLDLFQGMKGGGGRKLSIEEMLRQIMGEQSPSSGNIYPDGVF